MQQAPDQRVLFVFRHGETDWNREGRLQGHTDTPLNATGLAQAEALSEILRPHRLDAVLSSDLLRASTTGRIVAEALGVPLFTDRGLRETNVGAAEGLLWADAKTRFGEGLTEALVLRWRRRLSGRRNRHRDTNPRAWGTATVCGGTSLPAHRRVDPRCDGAAADETRLAAGRRASPGAQYHAIRSPLPPGRQSADRRRARRTRNPRNRSGRGLLKSEVQEKPLSALQGEREGPGPHPNPPRLRGGNGRGLGG
jgi:hypothetical protein